MTRYVGLEPWHGGDDVVAVDMEDGHHELRGFYDFVRLEIDGEVLVVRFRGREGDSTPDLSLTFSGCRRLFLESDPELFGRCEPTEFHSFVVEEAGESVSTFDISLHDLRIVVSTTMVQARYGRPG